MKRQLSASCIRLAAGLLLMILWSAAASAQGAPSETVLTFARAVRLPGTTLPAGTYVFERSGFDQNRTIVHVFRTNPRRLVTTLMTVPTMRDGGGADVVFANVPHASIPVLAAWYQHGTQAGYAFLYRRSELERIAEPGVERSTR